MLRRTTLIVLALLGTAAAGLFAADRMGVNLPWNVASTSGPGASDTDANGSAATGKADEPASDTSKTAETAIEETVAALTGDQGESAEPGPGSVALDISRVSPDGPSVFAGRAEPNAYVTVFADGKPAGTVRADAGGSWSLSTEYKFASADPNITFEAAAAPPPEPEPEKPVQTAAADETSREPEQPAEDAPAAAGDVMRKFEDLVSEAREEAAAEEAKRKDEAKAEEEKTEAARTDAASADAAPAETAREEESSEPETTVAAQTAAPPPVAAAPSSAQPQGDTAKEKDDEPTSDARTSANADATPGASSTVSSEADKASAQTETAMMAAPALSAKPETPAPIPVPIMFVYNQPKLTPEGERAAELLLEYLLLKRLDSIELTGHADERGTLAYNFDLSRERLDAVARILKDGGYKGDLKLSPKGKTEPFAGIDRKKYRGEALYQFDRRVELRVAR